MFTQEEPPFHKHLVVDDNIRQLQIEKIRKVKSQRDNKKAGELLNKLESTARSEANLMPVILECVESYATLGEIADTLRRVFGLYTG